MVTGKVQAIASSIEMLGKSSLSYIYNAFSTVFGLLATGVEENLLFHRLNSVENK